MVVAVLAFNMFLILTIKPKKMIYFDAHGIIVLVDDMSLGFLQGAQLDYVEELLGSYFKVENPNATASCGCGTSLFLFNVIIIQEFDAYCQLERQFNEGQLGHVIEYCKAGHTDVILAQELKMMDEAFPHDAFQDIG